MSKKYQRKRRLFIVVPMLLALSCCGSLRAEKCSCPVYPVGGAAVGRELRQLSYDEYPHLWEWLGRVNKLRQELELCSKTKNP